MRICCQVTPDLVQDMADAIDGCDTAFVVLSLSDGLSPQGRQCLKEAWRAVQSVRSVLAGPDSAYAQAVAEARATGTAP